MADSIRRRNNKNNVSTCGGSSSINNHRGKSPLPPFTTGGNDLGISPMEMMISSTKFRGEPDGSVDNTHGRVGSGRANSVGNKGSSTTPEEITVVDAPGVGCINENFVVYGTKANPSDQYNHLCHENAIQSDCNSASPNCGGTQIHLQQRPYSLYDVGKKFYTLSEASMRKSQVMSQHLDITKCNSVGKCNSVVEVNKGTNVNSIGIDAGSATAYSEIERFNRTLESEGVYMRNTALLGSQSTNVGPNGLPFLVNGLLVAQGGGMVDGITYGTLPRSDNPGNSLSSGNFEKIYGIMSSGNNPLHANGSVVGNAVCGSGEETYKKREIDGAEDATSKPSSSATLTKNGRIKRVRRTGFMALRVGRFTKNSEKKKNSTNNSGGNDAIGSDKTVDSTVKLPGHESDANLINDALLPQRSNSLDHLNFEEKRKLIASSLSLSEMLSNGVNGIGGSGPAGPHSRHLYGINVTSEGSSRCSTQLFEAVESKNNGRKTPDEGSERDSARKKKENDNSTNDDGGNKESSIERKLERFGIGLIGMGSNIVNNSSNLPLISTRTLPSANNMSRPSSPSPLLTNPPSLTLPNTTLPTMAHPYDCTNMILLNNPKSTSGGGYIENRLPLLSGGNINYDTYSSGAVQSIYGCAPPPNHMTNVGHNGRFYSSTSAINIIAYQQQIQQHALNAGCGSVVRCTTPSEDLQSALYTSSSNSSNPIMTTGKGKLSSALSLSDLLSVSRSSKGMTTAVSAYT